MPVGTPNSTAWRWGWRAASSRGGDFELDRRRRAKFTGAWRASGAGLAPGCRAMGLRARSRGDRRAGARALNSSRRDVQYLLADGKVQIIDEYTGRVMPDRSWERGLHQLVEAKESCEVTGRRRTLERSPTSVVPPLPGSCRHDGTAVEVAPELEAVYGLTRGPYPAAAAFGRPISVRRFFLSAEQKWQAVVRTAAALQADGRAGADRHALGGSLRAGQRAADAGRRSGTWCSMQARTAGGRYRLSRGSAAPASRSLPTWPGGAPTSRFGAGMCWRSGGLHVILTEFHELARIDRQLFGRAGAPGRPRPPEAIVALDDELFRQFCGARLMSSFKWLSLGSATSPALLGSLLKTCAQAAAETVHARARRAALADGRRFDEALGFAGRV